VRDLLVIVPSRGRPGRLAEMMDACLSLSQAATDIAVGYDEDDPCAPAYAGLADLDAPSSNHWACGRRNSMGGWTNHLAAGLGGGYRALAPLGDDHVPRTPGWDRLLLESIDVMGGTGIAYGDDLLQRAALPTSIVMSRDIADALGWICEPSMRHYNLDNVWQDLGLGAGCLAYREDVVIEHNHPGASKAPYDATYAEDAPHWPQDLTAYQEWRHFRMADDIAKITALKVVP